MRTLLAGELALCYCRDCVTRDPRRARLAPRANLGRCPQRVCKGCGTRFERRDGICPSCKVRA